MQNAVQYSNRPEKRAQIKAYKEAAIWGLSDVGGELLFSVLGKGGKLLSKLFAQKMTTTSMKQVESKLANYLLNTEHSIGKFKAEWFKKALGFTKENLKELAKQIKFDKNKAVFQKNNGYGDLYEQVINVKGANGKNIDVKFDFIIKNGEKDANLVTAKPTK